MGNSTVKNWVIENLNRYKYTDEVRKRYDQFKLETGSPSSYNSFKKEISRWYRSKLNKGQWIKGSPEEFSEEEDSTEERAEFVEEGPNNAYAYSQSEHIRSVDDLIKACDIDLDVWDIVSQKIKKQDIGIKDKEGKLDWDGGKMSGSLKYGRYPVITPMFHIQIFLQRKVLVNPKFELPHPVIIQNSSEPKIPEQKGYSDCALILSDAQMTYRRNHLTGKLYPVHDRKVMLLAARVAELIQPTKIIYNGDFFDLPDWSDKFISSPDMYFTFQPALLEFAFYHQMLKQLSPCSEFHYIPGNHCQRLENSIMKNAASAFGLYRVDSDNTTPVLSLKNLLAHDTNGIEFEDKYPDGHVWLNDKLRIGHGDKARNKSGATVRNVIEDATYSQVFGHIHRIELTTRTIRERNYTIPIHIVSFGTMSSIDDGVVPSNKSRHNWQQGFGIEYYDDKMKSYPSIITVIDGETVFEGERLFVDNHDVRGYIDNLCEDTGTSSFKI